jgi:hypothetical protein
MTALRLPLCGWTLVGLNHQTPLAALTTGAACGIPGAWMVTGCALHWATMCVAMTAIGGHGPSMSARLRTSVLLGTAAIALHVAVPAVTVAARAVPLAAVLAALALAEVLRANARATAPLAASAAWGAMLWCFFAGTPLDMLSCMLAVPVCAAIGRAAGFGSAGQIIAGWMRAAESSS